MGEISIDHELEETIEERIAQTKFNSVDEYVDFVLREVLDASPVPDEEAEDKSGDLRGQLEDLGYL